MTVVRIKGLKRYRSKGSWYAYHRKSGIRLQAEFGTGEFFAELAAIESKLKSSEALPGTLGLLFSSYRSSPSFSDLAPASKAGYGRMMNLLKPIDGMPILDITPQFIARLRDRIAEKHGRRQANYVMAVVSVAFEHAKERGIAPGNPVKGVKRVKRAKNAAAANRPWTVDECRTVITSVPEQLRLPIALAMFTGLRKGDVLSITKAAIKDGKIWRKTNKTGQKVSIPIHPDLAKMLAAGVVHNAVTIAATSKGTPWTESGFNSSFIKAMAKLNREGKIGDGLTFHGLRHTVGTLLTEAGYDLDTVRRWLGQKTLAMAIHYSESADTSKRMKRVNERFDPLGSKTRT